MYALLIHADPVEPTNDEDVIRRTSQRKVEVFPKQNGRLTNRTTYHLDPAFTGAMGIMRDSVVLAAAIVDSPASQEFFDPENQDEYKVFSQKATARKCQATPRVRLELNIGVNSKGLVDCPGLRRYLKYFPGLADKLIYQIQVASI